jgi:ATP-dependent DNA helicase RecG
VDNEIIPEYHPDNYCRSVSATRNHYQSRLRNKLIAEAFYLTKNIEKYGSGFIRIRKELETYPEIIFAVEEIGGGVLVTFGQAEEVNGGVNGGVSGGADEVLNYIRMNPGVKTSEIAAALDIPQRTLERWLKRLKDEKKVSFKGAPKKGGYVATEGD